MAEKKKAKEEKATEKVAKTTPKEPAKVAKTEAEKKPEQKSKMGWLAGLIVAVAVVIIGAIIAICLNKPGETDPTARVDYSKSFFIRDDGEYSLWNADGKRLTEDKYEYQSGFVGGYAMVEKDNKYGVIHESGRMSVDFGKYGSISAKGGLYLAEDGNTQEQSLITGTGTVLAKGEKLSVDTPNSSSGFAVIVTGGKMRAYNYAGTLMVEADATNDDKEPQMNTLDDFGILHYGEKNWVFDIRSGKVLASFDGVRYSFDSATEDRTMILLDDYDNSEKYKLIANGKLYDLDETKYYGLTDLDNLIGYDNYEELALTNDEYKVVRRVSTYLQLKDANNFATEKKEGGVEIYHNGEKVKEFGEDAEIAVSGLLYNNLYAVKDGEKVKFYNMDGSVAFEKEFVDVDALSDKFHHAVVAEKEGEYYIMDAKGNRVNEVVAKGYSIYDGGYRAKNSEGKYAILDKNGKPVTDFRYTEVLYRSIAEPHNIWTAKNENGMSDVIDADNGKAIFGGAKIDGTYSNYFTVKSDEGAIEYYTYEGKLFYSTAK